MALVNHFKNTISLLSNVKLNLLNKRMPEANERQAVVNFQLEQARVGEQLFKQFFQLGCQACRDQVFFFKDLNDPEVKASGQLIVEIENWLYSFLSSYPHSKIIIDEHESLENDALEVRSGFQFMLDMYKGVDEQLDSTLATLRDDLTGEFDGQIRLAQQHIEKRIVKDEWYTSIPQSHTWWF
jgi:hypothetical protein